MERIAIIDHDTHTLYIEDIDEDILNNQYWGEEERYIKDHYKLENYSWDYIAKVECYIDAEYSPKEQSDSIKEEIEEIPPKFPLSSDNDSMQEEAASEELEKTSKQMAELARKKKAETSSPFFSEGDYQLGFKDCAEWQKKQMMKKAIEIEVQEDAGGYPYIERHIELYDYDKDEKLAKRGDKVKVIIVKEG